jgi:hypothetical protein
LAEIIKIWPKLSQKTKRAVSKMAGTDSKEED